MGGKEGLTSVSGKRANKRKQYINISNNPGYIERRFSQILSPKPKKKKPKKERDKTLRENAFSWVHNSRVDPKRCPSLYVKECAALALSLCRSCCC